MSELKYIRGSQIKTGNYVLLDDVPCKVSSVQKSKPGKHGSARVVIQGIGLFDGKKKNGMFSSGDDVPSPMIEKVSAQIIADLGKEYQIMEMSGAYETFTLPKPTEGDFANLDAGKEVELIRWEGQIQISRVK